MKKYFLSGWILFTTVCSLNAQTFEAVKALAQRRVPWLVSKLEFSVLPQENGKDVFQLSSASNKIHIAASNASAAAKALGFYLKNHCHRSMSHMGDNLSPVAVLPLIKEPVKVVASADIRYALNYCTINYTMSFYKWKEWEHELDWMALNGVNLVLASVGVEIIWQNTLKQLGYSDKESLDFIAGPAFSAWWLMGNMEGWGGPVTQSIIDQQAALQKNILSRMKALGMKPVMQGFYGMVPTTLKHKNVELLEQGQWAGGFLRPSMLKPNDDFSRIAGIYYNEMKKQYGDDLYYFAGDPFHEGGKSGAVSIADYGELIQREMQKHFPGSVWVLQGWQNNPTTQILSKLDKTKVLAQELFGENTSNWFNRKGYEGTPFIWCTVSNFGEKSGLYGKLQRFANEVYRAHTSAYASMMKGVGIMPEGLHNNPVLYDLVLDLGWQQQKVETTEWIKSFVTSRYGRQNKTVQQAWQLFLETIYSSFEKKQEGPGESVFCARPSLEVSSVSSWGTRARNYDQAKFKEAVKLFVSAASAMKGSETYETDKVDLLRQVLSNEGEQQYAIMINDYKEKNAEAFTRSSNKFLSMINMQDSLLNSNNHFQLHSWLKQAWDFGKTTQEKRLALKNAKIQITYWGPDDPATDLHEYANKEWSGLMKYYYLPRWEIFIKEHKALLKGEEVKKTDYFSFEKAWAEKPDMYQSIKIPPAITASLIKRILN